MADETTVLNVRVPIKFKKIIEDYVQMDTHMNESELVRNAIRDYIKTNAPELYQKLFISNNSTN